MTSRLSTQDTIRVESDKLKSSLNWRFLHLASIFGKKQREISVFFGTLNSVLHKR